MVKIPMFIRALPRHQCATSEVTESSHSHTSQLFRCTPRLLGTAQKSVSKTIGQTTTTRHVARSFSLTSRVVWATLRKVLRCFAHRRRVCRKREMRLFRFGCLLLSFFMHSRAWVTFAIASLRSEVRHVTQNNLLTVSFCF